MAKFLGGLSFPAHLSSPLLTTESFQKLVGPPPPHVPHPSVTTSCHSLRSDNLRSLCLFTLSSRSASPHVAVPSTAPGAHPGLTNSSPITPSHWPLPSPGLPSLTLPRSLLRVPGAPRKSSQSGIFLPPAPAPEHHSPISLRQSNTCTVFKRKLYP